VQEKILWRKKIITLRAGAGIARTKTTGKALKTKEQHDAGGPHLPEKNSRGEVVDLEKSYYRRGEEMRGD